MAFNSTRTATSTRDSGREINATVRELTGVMSLESSVESILETGLKIRNMAEAHSSTRTEIDTMDTGLQGCHRVKAE